jgi:hypothetical protein
MVERVAHNDVVAGSTPAKLKKGSELRNEYVIKILGNVFVDRF